MPAGNDALKTIGARAEDAESVEWIDEADLADGAGDEGWWKPGPAAEHDREMDVIEGFSVALRALVAEQYRLMAEIVRDAEAMPDPWVGPDPTLDPAWSDVRGRGIEAIRRDRQALAVRAAVADIAVRLRMDETTLRKRAVHAETLRQRCPLLWSKFLGGQVSESNAVSAAQFAATIPEEGGSWVAFDEQVAVVAVRLTPGKFRTAARSIRERVHTEVPAH